MAKKRTGTPWIPAAEYAATLQGLGINLMVRDIERSLPFHLQVLGAQVLDHDVDFAALKFAKSQWMLHAWHSDDDHPLHRQFTSAGPHGIGAELRLYGPIRTRQNRRRCGSAARSYNRAPTRHTAYASALSRIRTGTCGCPGFRQRVKHQHDDLPVHTAAFKVRPDNDADSWQSLASSPATRSHRGPLRRQADRVHLAGPADRR